MTETTETKEVVVEPTSKKAKTFKEYYKNPEFREKHLKYMKTKVVCACGTPCERCNMFNHKRTKKHIKQMAKKELEENQIQILHREIEELKEQLKNIYEYCVAKLP